MDLLRKGDNGGDGVVLLSQDASVISELSVLHIKVMHTIEELTRRCEPRAIILDRQISTEGTICLIHEMIVYLFTLLFLVLFYF